MELEFYRTQINEIDEQLTELLEKRFSLTQQVGKWKQTHCYPIYDEKRESAIMQFIEEKHFGHEVEIKQLYQYMMELSKQQQKSRDI